MAIQRNRCYVCDKGVAHGNSRSHANNSVRRTWKPNLQVARILIEGKVTRVKVCTPNGDFHGVMNPGGKPIHISSEADRTKVPGVEEFFVDLGRDVRVDPDRGLHAGHPREGEPVMGGAHIEARREEPLEPRRVHFQYPPYFPALFQGMRLELDKRGALPAYGVMADTPAGRVLMGMIKETER